MTGLIGLILSLLCPALFLVLGIAIGGHNERRHLRELEAREQIFGHIRVNNLKRVTNPETVEHAVMVMGNVVIATDYFKSFATGLRALVGGEMKAAQTLLTRARREALLRALEQAQALGAQELWAVRFGTSTISQVQNQKGAMQVEVLAWATAVRRHTPTSHG